MATSISSLYKAELDIIREEQEAEEQIIEAQAEKSKMYGGGSMQAQSWIGKTSKKAAEGKLGTEFQYMKDNQIISGKKFEVLSPDKGPTWFGDKEMGETSSSLWESAQDYLGMEFGGEGQTSKVGLTSDYVKESLESGAGVEEFGISAKDMTYESLFPDIIEPDIVTPGAPVPAGKYDPTTVGGKAKIAEWKAANPDIITPGKTIVQQPGATSAITAKVGEETVDVGMATITKAGEMSVKMSEEGAKKAIEGVATESAGKLAGQAAAGVGIVTGGAQFIGGINEGEGKDVLAGGLKAAGSAMMLTGVGAPVGMAMSAVGTLLDFV